VIIGERKKEKKKKKKTKRKEGRGMDTVPKFKIMDPVTLTTSMVAWDAS
jgi:hypothetical protein